MGYLIPAGIFLVALSIRLFPINWGIIFQHFPYHWAMFEINEPAKIVSTFKLLKPGHPYIVGIKPILHYLSLPFFMLYMIYRYLFGEMSIGYSGVIYEVATNMSDYIVIGRVIVAVVSASAIPLMFNISRRLFNGRIAVLTSLFLCFSYGEIIFSNIYRYDGVLVTCVLLIFYFMLGILETNDEVTALWNWIGAGSMVAVATAAKPPLLAFGGTIVLFPLFKNNSKLHFKYALIALLSCSVLGTLIYLPVLMDVDLIIRKYMSITSTVLTSHRVEAAPYYNAIRFPEDIMYGLPFVLTPIIYFTAISGGVLGLIVKQFRRRTMIVITPLLLYWIPVGLLVSRNKIRDLIPLQPFFILLSGLAILCVTELFKDKHTLKKSLFIGLSILLVSVVGLRGIHNRYLIYQTDSRLIAKNWIQEHLPKSASFHVRQFAPPLKADKESLRKLAKQTDSTLLTELSKLDKNGKLYKNGLRHKVKIGSFDHNIESLRKNLPQEQIDYLIVSSGFYARFLLGAGRTYHRPDQNKSIRRYLNYLETNFKRLKTFSPNILHRPGPVITIFEVPDTLPPATQITERFEPFPKMTFPDRYHGYELSGAFSRYSYPPFLSGSPFITILKKYSAA